METGVLPMQAIKLYQQKYMNFCVNQLDLHKSFEMNIYASTGLNLHKKWIQLSDVAPIHEILRKTHFLAKPLKRRFE